MTSLLSRLSRLLLDLFAPECDDPPYVSRTTASGGARGRAVQMAARKGADAPDSVDGGPGSGPCLASRPEDTTTGEAIR